MREGGRLANYSGGTAPDSHRISFSARRAQGIDRATNGPPAGVYGSVVNDFRLAALAGGVKPRADLTRAFSKLIRHSCASRSPETSANGNVLDSRFRGNDEPGCGPPSETLKRPWDLTRTQFLWNRLLWNRHCEQSAAISLGHGTLLREQDRRVASLLAMTNRVRVSRADRARPLQSPPVIATGLCTARNAGIMLLCTKLGVMDELTPTGLRLQSRIFPMSRVETQHPQNPCLTLRSTQGHRPRHQSNVQSPVAMTVRVKLGTRERIARGRRQGASIILWFGLRTND